MNRLPISKETVFSARSSLPRASDAVQGVMEVDVLSDDGRTAAIEFQRFQILDDSGSLTWSWEAVTCWEVSDAT